MKAVLVLETRKSLVLEKGVWGTGKVGDIDMCGGEIRDMVLGLWGAGKVGDTFLGMERRLEAQGWVCGCNEN